MMNNDYNKKLAISFGSSIYSTNIRQEKMTFDSFIRHLSDYRIIRLMREDFEKLPNKEKGKVKNQGYFIFGAFNSSNIRKAENMISRDGITLDYDEISHDEMIELLQRLKEIEYNYLAYTTASYDGTNGKIRVIIPFSVPIEPKEYKAITLKIIDKLKLNKNIDNASLEYSHCFNVSTKFANADYIFQFEKNKKHINPNDFISSSQMNMNAITEIKGIKEIKTKKYKYDEKTALQLAKEYIKHEDISSYDRFIPVMYSIIKGVKDNEIDYQTGIKIIEVIANGNPEYEKNNKKLFEYNFSKNIPKTEYSFSKRFDFNKKGQAKNKVDEFIKNMKVTTGFTFNDMKYQEEFTFVKDILPTGVGFLAGSPKIGKSFLAMQMLISIANGDDFISKKTVKSNVLYISLEMNENLLNGRLKKMYKDMIIPNNFVAMYELPIDNNALFEVLEECIIRFNSRVVVIDTYGIIEKQKNNKSDIYNQSYEELRKYKKLAEKYNISILLITHLNKSNGNNNSFDRIMGSTANRGAVDFNMIITENDEKDYIFQVESRKLRGQELVLSRNWHNLQFEYLSAVDEYRTEKFYNLLVENPIIKAIRKELSGKNKIELTASNIYELIPENESYDEKMEELTPKKIGIKLNKLIPYLKKHFNITTIKTKKANNYVYIFSKENHI